MAETDIEAYAALSVFNSIISLLFVKNVSGFYRQIQEAEAFQEGLKRELAEAQNRGQTKSLIAIY